MSCHFVRWTSTDALPDLQRLPDELIASLQRLPTKRRERSLKSRAMLAEVMFHFFGYPMLPALTQAPHSRPCFTDPRLPDFCLAYAGNTVAILLSETGHVGVDIEIVHLRSGHPVPLHLQGHTSSEQAWINAQSDPLEAAIQLRTLRQAIVKMSPKSLWKVNSLKLHPASGRLRSTLFPALEAISDIDDYLAWGCAQIPTLDHLVTWVYAANGTLCKTGEIVQQQRHSQRYIKLISQATKKCGPF